MWKRDEGVRLTGGQPMAASESPVPATAETLSLRPEAGHHMEKDIVNIGKSVVIKGELNGSEDLTIEGQVDGTIQLGERVLTIGPNSRIKAEVFAKSVIVLGEVTGNVTAGDKVDIRDNGSVDGDIVSPRMAIAEARALPRQRQHAVQGRANGGRQAGRQGCRAVAPAAGRFHPLNAWARSEQLQLRGQRAEVVPLPFTLVYGPSRSHCAAPTRRRPVSRAGGCRRRSRVCHEGASQIPDVAHGEGLALAA